MKLFFGRHPRLANWAFLSIGMVAMFLVAARGRGLTAGQLTSLIVACIGLAGACSWIISWE